MYFAIKVGSITNAQRARNVLRSKGYKPSLSRIENPLPGDGCGYVIKVAADDQNKLLRILRSSGITVLGV
ncbi:MAG: putative Se/S carrier-like protein, partial [Eubacterium sp.]